MGIDDVIARWHRHLAGRLPEGLDGLSGKHVNGVDIIRCDDAGKIVEFRVMIRPLQAVNVVHQQMQEMLAALQG